MAPAEGVAPPLSGSKPVLLLLQQAGINYLYDLIHFLMALSLTPNIFPILVIGIVSVSLISSSFDGLSTFLCLNLGLFFQLGFNIDFLIGFNFLKLLPANVSV